MRLIDADALIPTQVHTVVVVKDGREQLESVLYAEQVDDAPTVEPASPWHRVEEELPKVGTNCLVGWKHDDGFYYEDSVYGYGADGFGFWCRKAEHDKMVEPDYWMPIEPPKEDA